ncbi:hypothetical protein G7Z17_g945 [Cylindrodendrum hubeiense]|uniref:VOC domain-containing protein n=1 Tax=Cylindrodendrum hubeiense TaxID=595255 RepID=A0A9P5LKM4_9HYPO|nr:hypothetical protein G7Z17_g945 [Cylindrodendrum hubeiense]
MDPRIDYQGLDVGENQIRLIELHPRPTQTSATTSDALRCKLGSHDRGDSCPPYLALSYAWQHDGGTQPVIFNNKTCQVSETVEQALRQLRHNQDTVYVWVDQICINQNNDEEKNYQVQQMRHTYSQAESVIAWIGMPFPDAEVLFQFLEQIGTAVLREEWKTLTNAVDGFDLASMKDAFRCFCQRPYWKRLWIMQEFTVASHVRVVCGDLSIEGESLDAAVTVEPFFEESYWADIKGSRAFLDTIVDVYYPQGRSFVDSVLTRRQRYDPQSGGTEGENDHFLRVLVTCLVLEADYNWPLASDPRDRVFALIYLSSNSGDFGDSFVDYLKSSEEVYYDTTVAFLSQGHIDVLAYCQFPKVLSLPSWVVDWSMEVRNPCAQAPWYSKFKASGTALEPIVSQPQPGHLRVTGTSVDTITAYSDIWDPDWSEPLDRNAAVAFIDNILQLCKKSPRIRVNEELFDAVRIAAADAAHYGDSESEETFVEYLEEFMNAYERLKPDQADTEHVGEDDASESSGEYEEDWFAQAPIIQPIATLTLGVQRLTAGILEDHCSVPMLSTIHFVNAALFNWMDNGDRQQQMAQRIKIQVKNSAKRRRGIALMENIAQDLTNTSEDVDMSSCLDDGQPSPDNLQSRNTTSSTSSKAATLNPTSEPLDVTSLALSEPPPDHPSILTNQDQDPVFPTKKSDLDLGFITGYMDYVFPAFFPFYRPSILEGGRTWLLVFATKNAGFLNIIVSLSSYFYSIVPVIPGPDHDVCASSTWIKLQKQMDLALATVQRDLRDIGSRAAGSSLATSVYLLANITQLLNFELALPSGKWQMHLGAAISLFEQIIRDYGSNDTSRGIQAVLSTLNGTGLSSPTPIPPSPNHGAFRFFSTILIINDIIASTSLGRPPKLRAHHSELEHRGPGEIPVVRPEEVIGCEAWVLLAISDIASLDAWKTERSRSGLTHADLLPRVSSIETRLQEGFVQLDDKDQLHKSELATRSTPLLSFEAVLQRANCAYGFYPLIPELNAHITRIWAYAAHTYLLVVQLGWQPEDLRIRSNTTKTIDLFSKISSPTWLRALVWPFCACSFALNHVAISVPNLEAAIEWYTEVFGMTLLMPAITRDRSVSPVAHVFNVYPPDCNKMRVAFLSTGSPGAAGLELFEFEDPRIGPGCEANFGRDYKRGGFFHIAVTTVDVEAMAEKVEGNGGKRIGPIMPISIKHKACYVEDKWGNVIELISGSFEEFLSDR